jgi:GDPmannose 4,6-dehydratase
MTKTIAITGITGQTGSYLAERYLNEGHKVYGMIRKSSSFNTSRIEHIFNHPNLDLVYGDLSDTGSVNSFVSKCKPDYFFNMGALSHVKISFDQPDFVMNVDAIGVVRCLEAIRLFSPHTRFLQASTSELFGSAPAPQSEHTPMWPQSPYGCAKLAAYWMVKNYRTGYNLFAVNSISFNHESARRSPTFLTAKVVQGLVRIKYGLQKELVLGNLNSKRSWNHVNDIIDGMMLMINSNKPDDYVIGSNKMISVQEFVEMVAAKLDINWRDCIRIDSKYFRPNEVEQLEPNNRKIVSELGWQPKYSIDDIIDEMISEYVSLANNELLIKGKNQ